MRVIIWESFWCTETTYKHPNYLFIFGDNDVHQGHKGQAIIRDQPNAIGIPTKKYPSMKSYSFYSDDEFEINKCKMDRAIKKIKKQLNKYDALVLPRDGLGTGLARLDKKAPQTFKYLANQINKLVYYIDGF